MREFDEPVVCSKQTVDSPETPSDERSFVDRVVDLRNALHTLANLSLCIRENQKNVVRNLIDNGIGGVLNIIDSGNYTLVEQTTEAFGGEDIPVDVELSDLAERFYAKVNT